ncbi:MAG: hypothetical protein AAFU80_09635 [Pseudomonadota bacterium]
MRSIRPDQFARIMTLPQAERSDLLEFLGATPMADIQVEALIAQVGRDHRQSVLRAQRAIEPQAQHG